MAQPRKSAPPMSDILIAGASPGQAAELRAWLEGPGLRVTAEADAERLRQDLSVERFDCILFDEALVRSQGIFFVTQGAWNQGEDAPLVILMTSRPEEHSALLRQYGLRGVDLVLPKPYGREQALAAVRRFMADRDGASTDALAAGSAHR